MAGGIAVAVGSATQIALLVIPFCVLVAAAMDEPLTLYFNGYETATVLMTVILVGFIISDGSSNWLVGFLLIMGYLLVAAGFFAHKDEDLKSTGQ